MAASFQLVRDAEADMIEDCLREMLYGQKAENSV